MIKLLLLLQTLEINVKKLYNDYKGDNTSMQVPFFDNDSFFKNNQRVHIHLSTDYPTYVGVTHKHEFIEVVYILSGSAIHTVEDREYTVNRGDVVLINSLVPHKFEEIKSQEQFVTYDLMFTPDFLDYSTINMSDFKSLNNSFLFYSLFPEEKAILPDLHVINNSFFSYGEIFTRIYNEYKNCEKGFIQIIRAYCIELIIKIFRDLEKEGVSPLSPENKKTVELALNYINDNYSLKLSIGDIASQVFLSPDYFRKLFKKVTGTSVTNYLQKIRLDKACNLLLTTTMPIKDISIETGYTDIQTFYKVFKKATGKTPQNYRNGQ